MFCCPNRKLVFTWKLIVPYSWYLMTTFGSDHFLFRPFLVLTIYCSDLYLFWPFLVLFPLPYSKGVICEGSHPPHLDADFVVENSTLWHFKNAPGSSLVARDANGLAITLNGAAFNGATLNGAAINGATLNGATLNSAMFGTIPYDVIHHDKVGLRW